jgi:hypothetical protein
MTNPIKSLSKKIIALLVCAVLSFGFIYTVSAQSTIVNASASSSQPQVGSTLTVTLTISNVQNLAGIDTTLQWNPSILTLTNSALNLGDSHSNGVLHGTNLNSDSNNLNSGDVYVQEIKVSGSYQLVAQSIGASNPGFTGSGTIATLTFSVIHTGSAELSLQTDLADHPPTGQNAQNINHQDTASSVTAVTSGSSSTPTQNSPAPSPTVPEFPIITVIAIIIIATATIVTSAKMFKKQEKLSIKQ